jgi:hypothetical protein
MENKVNSLEPNYACGLVRIMKVESILRDLLFSPNGNRTSKETRDCRGRSMRQNMFTNSI